MEAANTLAHNNMTIITAVKSFIVQAPDTFSQKLHQGKYRLNDQEQIL